jgi:hypothetical protein
MKQNVEVLHVHDVSELCITNKWHISWKFAVLYFLIEFKSWVLFISDIILKLIIYNYHWISLRIIYRWHITSQFKCCIFVLNFKDMHYFQLTYNFWNWNFIYISIKYQTCPLFTDQINSKLKYYTFAWYSWDARANMAAGIGYTTGLAGLHRVQTEPGAHPSSYPFGNGSAFFGAKWPLSEADRSSTSSAEFRKILSRLSLAHANSWPCV